MAALNFDEFCLYFQVPPWQQIDPGWDAKMLDDGLSHDKPGAV